MSAPGKTDAPQSENFPHHMRGYWRSVIVKAAELNCAQHGLVSWENRDLRQLEATVFRGLLEKVDELVARACRLEVSLGRRSDSVDRQVDAALWNFLKPWSRAKLVPRETNSPQQTLFGDSI